MSAEEKEACRIVENLCRSLGKNVEVMFLTKIVSIAPPAWAADSTGSTLAEALEEALKHEP